MDYVDTTPNIVIFSFNNKRTWLHIPITRTWLGLEKNNRVRLYIQSVIVEQEILSSAWYYVMSPVISHVFS